MKVLLRKRVVLVLLLGLIAILFLKSDWLGEYMYPVYYKDDIRASASNYGLEPHLVAAVIRTESNYKTSSQSVKGAVGLMQMMPNTAKDVVRRAGFTEVTEDMLKQRADVSIELGSWYLSSLHQRFDQNSIAAIAAYNAGPTRVSEWLNTGEWDGKLETVKQIPYGETRHYVQRVIYYYNKYKELYPDF
ncbi:lytic transglycosylase domain-containing protein [Paenibacillus sp. YIM B09110]|uniref:lytic transglycosylase domain-containing protein n=1 Tax=Paenibacillus sp. YIM B09110 TaxID=3126102 RepID=UPI00301C1394